MHWKRFALSGSRLSSVAATAFAIAVCVVGPAIAGEGGDPYEVLGEPRYPVWEHRSGGLALDYATNGTFALYDVDAKGHRSEREFFSDEASLARTHPEAHAAWLAVVGPIRSALRGLADPDPEVVIAAQAELVALGAAGGSLSYGDQLVTHLLHRTAAADSLHVRHARICEVLVAIADAVEAKAVAYLARLRDEWLSSSEPGAEPTAFFASGHGLVLLRPLDRRRVAVIATSSGRFVVTDVAVDGTRKEATYESAEAFGAALPETRALWEMAVAPPGRDGR